MPLCATLGISAIELTEQRVELTIEWAEALCTSNHVLHGGATGTSTIESKTNLLGTVAEGIVTATATPLHIGRTTMVIEAEVRQHDRLVAKTTHTQTVLRSGA